MQTGIEEPPIEKVALEAGMVVEEVEELLGIVQEPISLDHNSDDDYPWEEILEAPGLDTSGVDVVSSEEIMSLFPKLAQLEIDIINKRYGFDGRGGRSPREVGEELEIPVRKVKQREMIALSKLKHMQRSLHRERNSTGLSK